MVALKYAEEFEKRKIELLAKVPKPREVEYFSKDDFEIDLENKKVTCPQGHTTSTYRIDHVIFGKEKQKRAALKSVFLEQVCAVVSLANTAFDLNVRRARCSSFIRGKTYYRKQGRRPLPSVLSDAIENAQSLNTVSPVCYSVAFGRVVSLASNEPSGS